MYHILKCSSESSTVEKNICVLNVLLCTHTNANQTYLSRPDTVISNMRLQNNRQVPPDPVVPSQQAPL